MSEEHAYRVAAWWTSGRTGLAKSDSAPNAIHFTAPTEFGGLEGRWTPEELLLAAVAGCYTTTLRAIAGTAHVLSVHASVEAGPYGRLIRATVLRKSWCVPTLRSIPPTNAIVRWIC